MKTVLHVLSQRPSLTGSGVTVDALVRLGKAAGWRQAVAVGVPEMDSEPRVGDLNREFVHPLEFETDCLPFPVPGMSDVMPYRSSLWSTMTKSRLDLYTTAWRNHIEELVARYRPDVIHSHHVWLMSSLIKDVAPNTPVVTHCHATGLRQIELCPELGSAVRRGIVRNERFVVLHELHAQVLAKTLDISPDRIAVVGAGYREDVFNPGPPDPPRDPHAVVFVGKFADSKGLPWLLDAIEKILPGAPGLSLHVVGDGSGARAEELRARMQNLPWVVLHGRLDQDQLARVFRASHTSVLPSFYEGLPLVLVEAAACGCRLVATDLPGIRQTIAPYLRDTLTLVPCPQLDGPDTPVEADLPAFVDHLADALVRSVKAPTVHPDPVTLHEFTWLRVFERMEKVWMEEISRREV